MDSLSQLTRAAMIEQALKHPQVFVARYFANGHTITGQQDFQAEWWEFADLYQRLLLLAPRDSAKTTNLSIWYVIRQLCKWRWEKQRDPNIADPRIAIVSNTEGQAEGALRAITIELETNEKLIADFGKFKPDHPRKWTNLELIIEGWKAPNAKDVTLFAGGYGSAWLGRRVDLLIGDDLADLKVNSGTEDARAQLLQWFKEVVTNTLEKHGRAILIGTMQHHQDLYNTIIREERERKKSDAPRVWTVRKYQAIIRDETATLPAVVLWPEKSPYEYLLFKRSEIGTAAFEKNFQNKAVNEDLLCFRSQFLDKCLDPASMMGSFHLAEGEQIFIGVDPASGQSAWAKFFVMIAVAIKKDSPVIRIIDIFRDKINVTSQLKWLNAWWNEYHPAMIIIETNAYQTALREILSRDYPYMRVQGQFTAKNKIDPEVGIVATMAPIVENHILQIPYGDPMSQRKAEKLTDELKLWPEGEYSDQVMALWIACSAARDLSRRPKSQPGIWNQWVQNPAFPLPKTGKPLVVDDPEQEKPVIDLTRRGRLFRPASEARG